MKRSALRKSTDMRVSQTVRMVWVWVADPATATETGRYDSPGTAHDVAVSGDVAYVADGFDGLRIVDVSDTSNPVEVGSVVPGDIKRPLLSAITLISLQCTAG